MTNVFYSGHPLQDSFSENFICTYNPLIKDTNSQHFRSDEFTNIHNGKHVLFSGCSNTFGVGLERHEGWAWKTYEKIIEKEKCSGFFNLGAGGTGIMHMVINIFKYCKKNGNPDVIFINLSNQNRSFYYLYNIKGYSLRFDDDKDFHNIKLHNFQYYFMLEQYCKSNNIRLYSMTWDHARGKDSQSTTALFDQYNFKTFYQYSGKELQEYLMLSDDKHNEYYLKARDNLHQGIGYNNFWSDFIYDKYEKDNYDKKD
jgi:hypothetical protein